jgi:glycosyltransferase involved in cell wall biosynthesis
MNILHVCETLPGGIASYLQETIPSQCSMYEKVVLIVPADQKIHIECLCGIADIVEFGRTGRNLGSIFNLIKALIYCFKNYRFDAVFCHSSFAGLVGRLHGFFISRNGRPKYLYIPHGIAMIMNTNGKLKNLVYSLIERSLCWLVTDKVVCVSRFEYDVLISFGFCKDKLCLIYNGVKSIPVPLQKQLHEGPLRILFVGRFDKEKGLYKLLQALKSLDREYRCRVIGGGVKSQSDNLPFPEFTENLGWLSREDINYHYAWADVVVIPSEWEAFGLVAVEAMNNACAVIAESVGGLKEIVVDGETGYLVDGEAKKYLNLLSEVSVKQFHEMGLRGRARFLELFDSSLTIEATSNLIDSSCVEGHR